MTPTASCPGDRGMWAHNMKSRIYEARIVVKDPDYYVGRIMVLSFAVFGFIDLIMEGALWLK